LGIIFVAKNGNDTHDSALGVKHLQKPFLL